MINIIGLYWYEIHNCCIKVDELPGQAWYINDYYNFYKDAKPDKIFNLHYDEDIFDRGRRVWTGWKEHYHDSNAGIITLPQTTYPYPHETINIDAIQRLPKFFSQCSLTMILGYAYLNHKEDKEISLYGFRMNAKAEYAYEIPAIVFAIQWLEAKGYKIHCRYLKEWKQIVAYRQLQEEQFVYRLYYEPGNPNKATLIKSHRFFKDN